MDSVTESPGAGTAVPTATPESVFGAPKSEPAIKASESVKQQTPNTPPATREGKTGTPPAVPAQQPQAPAPTTVAMTEEQLATLAQKMAASVQPRQTQPEAPATLTPEQQAEFDRSFNVVRVTPEIFQSIMGYAPENAAQLKSLESFAHGIVKQAAAMTMYQVQQLAQEREGRLTERLSPVLQHHQQQQATAVENKLYELHPDLKDFGGLVAEVAAAEHARGTRFKSTDEAINFVANKARTLLGNRAISGTTQSTTTQGNTSSKPSMPTTSVGGRSGASSSPQPALGPKAVFGDLDGSR